MSANPDIFYEQTISAPLPLAWGLLTDFGGWAKWCPLFKSMRIINGKTGVDSHRKYTTITESTYEEVLTKLDDDNYTFSYDFVAITPSQAGLNGITHTVAMVSALDDEKKPTKTTITWTSWFKTGPEIPEQIRRAILGKQRQAYEKILETLTLHVIVEKYVNQGMEFFNDKVMNLTKALLVNRGTVWEYDTYPDWMGFMPKMVKGLPTSEALSPQRMADMLARFLEVAYLQIGDIVSASETPEQHPNEINYEKGNLGVMEYGKKKPEGLKTVTTHLMENWDDDVEFCRQLLQGVNPVHIKRVLNANEVPDCLSGLYVTDPSGKDKNIADLVQEKRLFILDYRELAKFDLIPPAYFTAPVMLVYREIIDEDTSRLNVLGIQLSPNHKEIYTPGMKQKNRYKLARLFVACADNQLHEFKYHLGISHLGFEPVVVAVNNRLPKDHPVRVLLTPHLEGLIGINFFGRQTLVAEKEAFTDKTMAIGTKQGIRLISDGWRNYDFYKSSFPEDLKKRGFDGTDGLKDYFYRDDGFKLWNAIGGYTTDFVNKFYPTEADVTGNSDLQRWADEMHSQDGAAIPNFPQTIKSKEKLAEILQILIWNGSAQHSAVNFPQYPYASYIPNRPNALYKPMPEFAEDDESDLPDQYIKDALAPQFETLFQLALLWILTLPAESNFSTLRALKDIYPEGDSKFQKVLSKMSTEIKARNIALEAAGKVPYIYLLPENVACSTNI